MTMRACFFLLFLLARAAAFSQAPSVVEYELGNGVLARLGNDGIVQVGVLSGSDWQPMLRVSRPQLRPARTELPTPLTTVAWQSDPPESRVFFLDAYDDVDGFDDGLFVEEDEPAHRLVGSWDLAVGDRGQSLQTHHWNSQHLSGLMVAVYSQHGDGIVENLQLSLLMPGTWVPMDDMCPPVLGTHGAPSAPDAPQFLAHIADPRPGEPALWVGVAMLDQQPRQHSDSRIRIHRADLVVPPMDARQILALAAGPTRLRVMEDLRAAFSLLLDGNADQAADGHISWRPTIKRHELADDLLPVALLRLETSDRFSLVFDVSAQQYRFWDPDLFRLDGQVLGPADKLVWIDETGRRVSVMWSGEGAGQGVLCLPYITLGASGGGMLEIHFPGPVPLGSMAIEAFLLDAVHLDGRRGACHLTMDVPTQTATVDQEMRAADDGRRLQLSPTLLVPSPNPFHAATRISFQVPGTIGEAFDHEEAQRPTQDLQQRMPYADGVASVQVVVYNLEGRELATLYTGQAGVGTYETSWDGRDREGRVQASGTYFCRFQVDSWSVTRRLIFIR